MMLKKFKVVILVSIFLLSSILINFTSYIPVQAGSNSYINESSDPNYYLVGNNKVEFKVKKTNGYIAGIYNKVLNKQFISGNYGSLLEMNVGGKIVNLTNSSNNTISSYTITNPNSSTVKLQIVYNNIKATDNSNTNVAVTVNFYISDNDEFMSFDFLLNNTSGIGTVNWFRPAYDFDYKVDTHTNETISFVDWYGGTQVSNPYGTNYNVRLLNPSSQSMSLGWMDLSSASIGSGIGVAYINKPEQQFQFDVKHNESNADGIQMNPVLFYNDGQHGPEVGQTFTTGKTMIIPHSNDWHATADAYRTLYEREMVDSNGNPDYLTWANIPDSLKKVDYVHQAALCYNGTVINDPTNLLSALHDQADWYYQTTNASLEHCLAWIYGFGPSGTYGPDIPIIFPAYSGYGGTAALTSLVDNLHSQGASVLTYENPRAVDPNSSAYYPSTDPGQHEESWCGVNHKYVCIDNSIMQNLWLNSIIPNFRNIHVDGLQFDQGGDSKIHCTLPNHNHGRTGLDGLSQDIRSENVLANNVINNLVTNGKGWLQAESGSDIIARHIALWQVRDDMNPGALYEMRTYTFPQYRLQGSSSSEFMRIACNGGIAMINNTGNSDGVPAGWDQQVKTDAQRRYIALKSGLRNANAPGYPEGFRDNLGITVGNSNVYARVFKGATGITVVYYNKSTSPVSTTITVDKSKLGGSGIETIQVTNLGAGVGDFRILSLNGDGLQSFVTNKSLSTLRNDWNDYCGMKITVGSNPITVTDIGRYFASGNSQVHNLQIVKASDGTVVASAGVNMGAGTPDSLGFMYAKLTTPVLLSANTSYYIVSKENSGGDQFYQWDTTVTAMGTATVNCAAYLESGVWKTNSTTNHMYGPLNFKYNYVANSLISNTTLGTSRNDWNDYCGTKITVGSNPITVSSIGRYYVAGNIQMHNLKIVKVSDGTVIASADVNMGSGIPDFLGFKYVTLPTQVTLSANTSYYIVSMENTGGDQFYQSDTTVTAGNAATVDCAAYLESGVWKTNSSANHMYGPLNFKY